MTPYDPQNPQNPQNPEQPNDGQPPQYPTPQQPGYGQPQPGYGQPGYPPAQPLQATRRSRAGMIAGIIVGVILLCVLACGGGLFALARIGQGAASSILTTLAPTETALAQQLTPSPDKTVIYQDSLTDTPDGWASNSNCAFKTDGYHVHGGSACLGPDSVNAANVDITVTSLSITTGQDTRYGIMLRQTSSGNFYSFEISPDGQWGFVKYVNGNGTLLAHSPSDASIQTGSSASNVLEVEANGSHFFFWVNGQPVGVASDSTFSNGTVGVINVDSGSTSEVVFTNFTVAHPQP